MTTPSPTDDAALPLMDCSALVDVPYTQWGKGPPIWRKEPCPGKALPGKQFCWMHQPDHEKQQQDTAKIMDTLNAAMAKKPTLQERLIWAPSVLRDYARDIEQGIEDSGCADYIRFIADQLEEIIKPNKDAQTPKVG